jgi:lipoate-protein ligase A
MKIELRKYNLPDALFFNGDQSTSRRPGHLVWKPGFTCIVLGFSSDVEKSVYIENVRNDNIPVFKRPSGGEAVLLSPRTLVVSAVKFREKLQHVKTYFKDYNGRIIRALESMGVKYLSQKGISDISIGEQKIVGSAIYQDKEKVFYHAVLNVGEPGSVIEKYLKHPLKEPGYRQGRRHMDFVTSLAAEGFDFEVKEIKKEIEKQFSKERDNP